MNSSSFTGLRISDHPSSEVSALRAITRNNVRIVNPKGLSPMDFLKDIKFDIPNGPPPPTPSPYFPIFPSDLKKYLFKPPKYFNDPDGVIANYHHPEIPVVSPENKTDSSFSPRISFSWFVFILFFL